MDGIIEALRACMEALEEVYRESGDERVLACYNAVRICVERLGESRDVK